MSPNPTEGSLVVIDDEQKKNIKFLCIFTDETNSSISHRFHLNLNGDTSTQSLYESAAKERSYVADSFVLSYFEYGEYGAKIQIDSNSGQTLSELLLNISSKKYLFWLERKDGNDPVLLGGATTVAIQVTYFPYFYFKSHKFICKIYTCYNLSLIHI